MKNQKTPRRLRLSHQTLRKLGTEVLRKVAGGYSGDCFGYTFDRNCDNDTSFWGYCATSD